MCISLCDHIIYVSFFVPGDYASKSVQVHVKFLLGRLFLQTVYNILFCLFYYFPPKTLFSLILVLVPHLFCYCSYLPGLFPFHLTLIELSDLCELLVHSTELGLVYAVVAFALI